MSVYYDEIPADTLKALLPLLMAGTARVEFDYDRVGWSRTGWVYRVYNEMAVPMSKPEELLEPDGEPGFVEPDCWGLDSYEHSQGQCRHQLRESDESLPTPEQVRFARSWGYDL